MHHSYSLLVTDDELLASPYIRRFDYLYDYTLHLGKETEVSFLLQVPLTPQQCQALAVTYDPYELELLSAVVVPYSKQTLVTLRLQPKEIGTIRLELACPDGATRRYRRFSKQHLTNQVSKYFSLGTVIAK